ncbi:RNA polymerase sigma factor [Dethiobacter alkaliphilus]|uniref:RNA polymerase, sigma-24 subunit, ECF subfamily n=1 Tax=Dethiobacter alkaliphilus AHT 1 TaxID=555088 RepID=C0GEH6_DETAL|nr:sigma-70 family RNA polymerase sigma factor [Dethiobacter alkaliphilus]EEG78470.1 RNA polymerase, sigma-24 subunit, ECF subfamily [Dethiobacter alkaliphilus AHT 1]
MSISKPEQILFEEHYSKVFKSVYLYCKDFHIAEDATQEAFLKAFDNINQLRDVKSFPGWVYVIALNVVKKEFNRNKKITELNFEDYQNIFSNQDEFKNIELKEDLKLLLKHISPEERKMLNLYYGFGLSLKEIAVLTDTNISTLKVKMHRTRQKLKKKAINDVVLTGEEK